MTGTSIGDAYDVEYLPGMIVFRLQDQEHRKVKRKKITLEEAFEGWNGSRETQDPWGNDANTLNGAEKDVWG